MDEHVHEEAAMPYTPIESEATNSNTGRVLEANRHRLMSIAGVEMVGIGQNALGDPVIVIGVHDAGVIKKLPTTIEGIKVQVEVMDRSMLSSKAFLSPVHRSLWDRVKEPRQEG